MEEVSKFLTSIELHHLFCKFEKEEITMNALQEMTEDNLEKIGIKMGPRTLILKALREHNASKTSTASEIVGQLPKTIQDQQRNKSNVNGAECHHDVDNEIATDASIDDVSKKINESVNEDDYQITDSDFCESTASEVTLLLEKVIQLKTKSKDSLSTIYNEIRRLFDSRCVFQKLKDEMKAEYGEVTGIIDERELDIVDDFCPIVITGETSAGKSTFLNLLLGVDLMPKSPITCTSTICRISNKSYKAMFLTDLKNIRQEVPDFDSKDDIAIQELLAQYLCRETSKQRKIEYRFVDIYWPFQRLKGNVMIVDTPGIGPDNPELTKRLFEYLPQALAFIYILNTPNAGGVQSDRILLVQEEIRKQSHLDPTKQFDPRRAIFICNKWDQIFEHPDTVFERIQTSLEDHWSGFQRDKLFKLSARQALIDILAKKPIPDDFQKVVKGIENMLPLTAEAQIRQHLQWQSNFIDRMLMNLSARMRNSLRSEEERMNILRETARRIQKLKLESEEIINRIYDKAFEKCKSIIENIHQHLMKESTKSQLFSWSDENLPNFKEMGSNDRKLYEIIRHTVNEEWRRKSQKEVKDLKNYVKDLLNAELGKIDKEFRDIDQTILGKHATLAQDKVVEIKIELPNRDAIGIRIFINLLKLIFKLKNIMSFEPVFEVGNLAFPFLLGTIVFDGITNQTRLTKYEWDKIKYANEMVDKYLDAMKQNEQYKTIGQVLLENMQLLLQEYCKNALPKRIAHYEALIKNIKADLRPPREIRDQCHETEMCIFPIYGHIRLAYSDIFGEKLFSEEDTKTGKKLAYKFDVNCEIELERCSPRAAVLTQMCLLHTEKRLLMLAEILNLRKWQHKNLCAIYCISSSFNSLEVYMDMCDQTLDSQVFKGKLEWEMCIKYLRDSLEGVNYLHSCGFVHKNIRLENIQIKENMAKLSGGGITEWASLTGKIEGIPIIRAPEVLKNRYCGYDADMFQFGIVLWECWYKKRAFWDNGKPVKDTYEELYRTIIDGNRPLFLEPKPKRNLRSVIEKCWQNDRDIRPSAKDVQKYIKM